MSIEKTARLAAGLPLLISLTLPLATFVDLRTSQTLESYSIAMYSDHGISTAPEAIYGLVYTAGGALTALWLLIGSVAWSGRRWTFGAAITAILINVALAATMLFATEYSEPVLPPVWGVLAAIPAVAGILMAGVAWQRRQLLASSGHRHQE